MPDRHIDIDGRIQFARIAVASGNSGGNDRWRLAIANPGIPACCSFLPQAMCATWNPARTGPNWPELA